MKASYLISISISILAGCGSKEARKSSTPAGANTAAAPASGSVAAPTTPDAAASSKTALPAELAKAANNRTLVAGPFAWPPSGTSAVVASAGSTDDSVLVWHDSSGDGEVLLPRAAAGGVVKEVTKDGTPELAIFAKPMAASPEWFEDQTMTWVVGINPKTKKPARMWKLEAKLIGAHDEASFDKEVATLGTFAATKDTSPVRLIARMPDATPAELQALVGAKGLKTCMRQGEKKKCTNVATKAIDAKKAKELSGGSSQIGEFAPDPNASAEDAEVLQVPSCQPAEKNPKSLLCGASVGGPSGENWVFEKTDAGLRLVEVGGWAEDS